MPQKGVRFSLMFFNGKKTELAMMFVLAFAGLGTTSCGGSSESEGSDSVSEQVIEQSVVSSAQQQQTPQQQQVLTAEPKSPLTDPIVNFDNSNTDLYVPELDIEAPVEPSSFSFELFTLSDTTSPPINFIGSTSPDTQNYQISLGSSPGSKDLVSAVDLSLQTGHTFTQLSLVECSLAYPSVVAIDGSGNRSDSLDSQTGFIYDVSLPAAPANLIVDSGAATYTGGKMVSWDAAADNCATTHYEVSIGSASGQTDVSDWVKTTNTTFQFSGLNLVEDTDYFTNVRSIDLANNVSTSHISSEAWRLPGVPAAVDDFGLASRGSFHIELAWTKPFDNGSPIIDYTVEIKKSSEEDWVPFLDGVSQDTILMVTDLEADTSYDFRVKSFNGNISPYSEIIVAVTLIDNTFFEATTYKAMNLGGATESKVVAYKDGTEIKQNDVSLITLNAGETYGFDSLQNDILEANEAFFVSGRKGGATDSVGNQGNMVWSSPDWAGKDFVFNAERFSPNIVTVYAFEDSQITITYYPIPEGAEYATAPVLAGQNHTFTISHYGSFKMESSGLLIAFTFAQSSGVSVVDPKPILPISKDIIGFPSSIMKLSSWSDDNLYKAVHSNGNTFDSSIDSNGFVKINPQGATTSFYQSESLRIIADDFVIGASYADGNGYCAAPFLPVSMMRLNYAVNVQSAYVAFASVEPGSVDVIDPVTGVLSQTLTLTNSGDEEEAPYKVRVENVSEGTIFKASVRVAAWYQPNTNDFAAADDETVMFGYDD